MIIDTHVHLNDPKFEHQLDQIIQEAYDFDVRKMIVIGYNQETSLKAIHIANRYPNIYATVGLHPSEMGLFEDDDLNWIEEYIKHPKVIAIGEIGLDYYWDKTYKQKQITYFKKQIEIAKNHQMPIAVHSRNAIQDTYDCLTDSGVIGVMHCYSGSLEMARLFTQLGFVLGIGGVLTFKNSQLRDIVAQLDLDHFVSETDAPYLAPVPYRGQINYPKYTRLVVEEIAKIKQIDLEMVMKRIEENTYRIFSI